MEVTKLMKNRKVRKVIVYLMIFAMLASTLLIGLSMFILKTKNLATKRLFPYFTIFIIEKT